MPLRGRTCTACTPEAPPACGASVHTCRCNKGRTPQTEKLRCRQTISNGLVHNGLTVDNRATWYLRLKASWPLASAHPQWTHSGYQSNLVPIIIVLTCHLQFRVQRPRPAPCECNQGAKKTMRPSVGRASVSVLFIPPAVSPAHPPSLPHPP